MKQDPAPQIVRRRFGPSKWSGPSKFFSLFIFFPSLTRSRFSALFVIFESSRVSSRAFSRCVPPRHLFSRDYPCSPRGEREREREQPSAGARERETRRACPLERGPPFGLCMPLSVSLSRALSFSPSLSCSASDSIKPKSLISCSRASDFRDKKKLARTSPCPPSLTLRPSLPWCC